MVVILLMFGLNLEAKSLIATTPVASGEVKSSQHVDQRVQIELNVPVDVYVTSGILVKYNYRGNTYSGVTDGKQWITCNLMGDARTVTGKSVELHNGHYTVHIKFKGIPNASLQEIRKYSCWHSVGLKNSPYHSEQTFQINNRTSFLEGSHALTVHGSLE